MKQFNFETDIERRSPFTGNMFMVDRMTSDWAERHPLNVDQLIEDVYQEFAGSEFEESREALRKVWMATLSMPVRGDKSVYPNKNGAHRPAAMKVWHVAGDYWRRGLRLGDTLPERCPSCKINRLEDGSWIALFPKDLHLLDENPATEDDFHSPNDRLNENDLNKLDNLSSDSMSVCSDGQAVDVETTPAVSPTDEEPMAKAEQDATDQNATAVSDHGACRRQTRGQFAEGHARHSGVVADDRRHALPGKALRWIEIDGRGFTEETRRQGADVEAPGAFGNAAQRAEAGEDFG